MNTNRLLKLIAVGVVLLAVSVGGYFLYRKAATSSQNKADISAIYQVVDEFGAGLKDVPDSSRQSVALKVAASDVGVRIVNGVRVFHVRDGLDIPIFKTSDGKNETISINSYEAIYLKMAPDWAASRILNEMNSATVAALDSKLKQLITDRFYQAIKNNPSIIPGKPVSGPYPESIEVDSLKKTDNASYMAKGVMNMVTSDASSAFVKVITLTVKSVNGIWLVDDIVVETFPTEQR